MIDRSDNQDTSVIHHRTETKPSRYVSHSLMSRRLETADAPCETIGKAVFQASVTRMVSDYIPAIHVSTEPVGTEKVCKK